MPKVVGQDQSVYKRITCKHCCAINEYAPGEVRTLWIRLRSSAGHTCGTKGFNCAGCGKEIYTERW